MSAVSSAEISIFWAQATDSPAVAAEWRDSAFRPEEAAVWIRAGVSAETACRARARGLRLVWAGGPRGPERAKRGKAVGG